MAKPLFSAQAEFENYRVTLVISPCKSVVIYINGSFATILDENQKTRLKLALIARQLWAKALKALPAGAYTCYPTTDDRRKVYIRAGWRRSVVYDDELIYYHLIPPLPERWKDWRP